MVAAAVRTKSPYLPRFIEMLEDRKLVRLDTVDGTKEDHFENRFKIQKYVFLAGYFDLDMEYHYNVYIHGPYSSELADDYYELAKEHNSRIYPKALPDSFDTKGFYEFVADKNLEWLEVASTLLSLNKSFTDKSSLLDRITNMKDHIPRDKIKDILSELEQKGFIKYSANYY
jgi:uncharacterized protein YwgA